jgi:hypothetical protein
MIGKTLVSSETSLSPYSNIAMENPHIETKIQDDTGDLP